MGRSICPPYNTISFTIRLQSGELWYLVVDNSHKLQVRVMGTVQRLRKCAGGMRIVGSPTTPIV